MDDIATDQQNVDNTTETGNGFVITPDQMKQLNDPECKHEWEVDPTDESDYWYAVKCKHCILGRLIKKS